MPIVESAVEPSGEVREEVLLEVDRYRLEKCRFRCKAADGTDFAFALEAPLEDGECVLETGEKRYWIRQLPEAVLRLKLAEEPAEAARVGWMIGNLHQLADFRDGYVLVGDDPGVRRLLGVMGLDYEQATQVFRPPVHSGFHSHEFVGGMEYEHSHFFGGERG